MGMYTEIFFKGEIPEAQARIISNLSADHGDYEFQDHELFRLRNLGRLFGGESAYFPGSNRLEISRIYGDSASEWRNVSFRSNLKNYDNEIEKFFDWIEPYVRDEGFYGYSQYEEAKVPTLYIKGDHAK